MVKNNLQKWFSLVFLSLLLSGCGGGGESDSVDSSSPSTNISPTVTLFVSSSVIVANQMFTITAQGSDSDGQITSYAWEQLSGPELTFTVNGNILTATAPSVESDTEFSFSVTVTDNLGLTAERIFSGTITTQNTPPTITITGPSSALSNTQVSLAANAQDVDGSINSIVWMQSAGISVEFTQADGILRFTAPNVSDNSTLGFSVTATDNAGESVQVSTTILITRINSAPTVIVTGPDSAQKNEQITLVVNAEDVDGTVNSINWLQTNGPVVEFTQTDTSLSFITPAVAQDTNITFLVTVTDNNNATNSAQKTITVLASNNPPVANDITIEVEYNQPSPFTLVVSDPDNDNVQIIFPEDLNGAQISIVDSQALSFNYTPIQNSIAEQSYTLIASDGDDTTEFLFDVIITDTSPATIISVVPVNTNEPVLLDTPISITFSDIMKTNTLVINTETGSCQGSVQVSADDFNTCLALDITSLAGTTDDTSDYFHTVTLSAALTEDTQYKVRVTNELINFAGTAITAQQITEFITSNQNLKITELSSVEFSNDSPWVEIYNGTGASVNLENYTLKSSSINTSNNDVARENVFSLPNKELKNGAYIILQSRFGDGFLANAAINNPKLALVGNVNDEIKPYWFINGYVELLNSDQTQTIDFVRFGNSTQDPISTSQWQGASASSMQSEQGGSLKRALNAADTNQATDWTYSVFNTPAGPNDITCTVDDDQDGIPDCAEQQGATFGGLPLYEWGARTSQKDIFIEVDYMDSNDVGITPHRTSLEKVISVFAEKGYVVHFDVGNLFDQNEGTSSQNYDLGGGGTVPFNSYTPFEYDQSSANLFAIKMEYADVTRRPIFHYLLMANSGNEDGTISGSGIAEVNGNDLLITMGGWGLSLDTQTATNVTYNYQASTIFHELGHNLGLYHGGNEEVNFKPNHLSSMNYLYQLAGLSTVGNSEGDRYYERFFKGNANCDTAENTNSHLGPTNDFIIDYSNGASVDLDENILLEIKGLNRSGSSPVDFNCNAITTENLSNFDANQDSQISILTDVDEWSMLNLQFYTQSAGSRFGEPQTTRNKLHKVESSQPMSNKPISYIKENKPNAAIIAELKVIKEQ